MKRGFRQIRAFLEIARQSSFTRSAQALHVSQPALTVQLRQLKDKLGVRLFDRDRRGVSSTAAGRSMLGPLQRILDKFDGVVEHGRDLAGLKRGRLTIAALPSIAAAWLPGVIRDFREREYPGIDIRVADVPSDQIQSLVRDEAADLGLGPWVSRDRAVQFRELLVDHMGVFFPPGHALSAARRPTLRMASRYPQILTTPGTSVRQMLHHALEKERPGCRSGVRGGLSVLGHQHGACGPGRVHPAALHVACRRLRGARNTVASGAVTSAVGWA
ncbi:HTH-type transcriptional regulator HdfR [Castellaniella defragrans]